MIKDDYTCEGQLELTDYLNKLSERNKKCQDCIYFKDFKCVRKSCHKLTETEGWIPLWTDEKNRNHGKWPTCNEWLEVETVIEDRGEFFVCDATAKDKTFKWPKESIKAKHFYGQCIAYRFKE